MSDKIKSTIAIIITLIIAGVAWHSVWEIHYLKSFYPAVFTVQEAFYATLVEWVKFLLISIPLVVIWLATYNCSKR